MLHIVLIFGFTTLFSSYGLSHEPLDYKVSCETPPQSHINEGPLKAEYHALTTDDLKYGAGGAILAISSYDFFNQKVWIMYDHLVLSKAPPELTIFVFEHECAHHKMGHTFLTPPPPAQTLEGHQLEVEADCEASKRVAQKHKNSKPLNAFFDFIKSNYKLDLPSLRRLQDRKNNAFKCYNEALEAL